MPDDSSVPLPTPPNYQRTTGGDHLRWQPPTPEHLQEMLPAYEVLSIIGQGGMGAVYKGRQKSLDRIIAIKILPPEAGAGDMQFIERFRNEARTMAKMNHPAIVHVYDFGETCEGQFYIVMEFIDGTDVAKMIQSQGKLPENYALSITAHVCDALGYAHTHGVVHRDIKPANILINMEGQVKVADFGLAKATDPKAMGLTQTNMTMGTPDFVSPEALTPGVPLDGRADLYAVGVMLYNMLTGTIPRGAFRMPSITLQTDARFDKIILKAMEMDRENRYQTALDLRRDLDVILTTPAAKSGGQPLPAQQTAQPQKPVGKSPSAPQGKEGSAGTPARSVPADKSVCAPAKKSNAVMIYGIAAAVVVAGGAFMFAGGGKKPSPTPKAVTEKKPEPKKPENKPATPPPAPAKPKPAPAPTTVAADKEKWVDGLDQWFGGTQTHKAFALDKSNGSAHVGSHSTLTPIPPSTPPFRDQVARVRWHPDEAGSGLNLSLRRSLDATGKEVGYRASLNPKTDSWTVRLGGTAPGKTYQAFADYKLPADFDINATHTMEFRVVDDLLTVSMDGKKVGERRDAQIADGHPSFAAQKVTVESFEYANLDPGGTAPAAPNAATTKPGDVLTFAGHRYQFHEGPFIKNEAQDLAASLGGHLVTITSAAEQAWIEATFADLIGGPKKKGLCRTAGDLAGSGSEKWTNGEPWGYTNWDVGHPKGKIDPSILLSQNGSKCPWHAGYWSQSTSAIIEWDDDAPAKPAPVASAAPAPTPVPAMPAAAPVPAPAAPAAPADPRLAQLAAGFKARLESDALQPFNTAVAALNTSYLTNGVSRARTAAKAKGSLSEVTALDDEKAAIEKGRGVPDEDDADTIEALKTLRSTYRTAYAKLAAERDAKAAPLYDLYLNALDAYIADLTQADKIADARKVQVFRDDIALQKPEATAQPANAKATSTSPASSAASKSTVRAPKMNEHEVAEWVISTGGNVTVAFGTPEVRRNIAVATELPRGRFNIIELQVNANKAPDRDLSPLASARDVWRMHLDNMSLQDKTFFDITPLRQMTALRKLYCGDLDAAGVDVIASLTDLDALFVKNLPEGSLEKIAKLKHLDTFESPSIIGPGIAALKSCKQLRCIVIENQNLSDDDIRALAAALPDLTNLTIGGTSATNHARITNACLPSLLSLKSLSKLALRSQELDDSVIEPLSKLTQLADLGLRSSKITGSNLEVLKKFDSLRLLYLDGCSITDEALDALVEIRGLTKLQFRDTKVTDAGIAKFKAARPGFNISK